MKSVEIVSIGHETESEYAMKTGRKIDLRYGPVYAGEVDGKVIFLVGFSCPWNGLAEVWLVPFDGFGEYIDVARKIRDLIGMVHAKYGFIRLHAVVDSEIEKNIRSLEYCGFKHEATLRAYGENGHDFLVMRRI